MLEYIKIEGFRSFRSVELKLPPLAALIGPNGSGKSNFLDLLKLINEAAHGRLALGIASRGGFDSISFKETGGKLVDEAPDLLDLRRNIRLILGFSREKAPQGFHVPLTYALCLSTTGFMEGVSGENLLGKEGRPVFLERSSSHKCTFWAETPGRFELEPKALESEFELAIFQVKDQDRYPTPYRILRLLQEWAFHWDLDVGGHAPMRRPALPSRTFRLTRDGNNLASVLFSIQEQDPATWKEIEEILQTAYPDFRRIDFPTTGGNGKRVLRWWEGPFEKQQGFSIDLLSDGILRLLCLVAVLKSPDPPPLICIDEPELGLHPDWIELVAELMQSASTRTQVIATTHSPQLIAKLSPEQVIVTEKENGETSFRSLSSEDLAKWLKEFTLGDLWLAGHFGGRP